MTKKYNRKKNSDKSTGVTATPKDIKKGLSLYRRQNTSQGTAKGRSSIKKPPTIRTFYKLQQAGTGRYTMK